MLTNQIIFKESGQYDKEVIQRLRLERLGLTRIASLDGCVSLIELNLSNNEITMISGLEGLVSLKKLDLSYNKIRKLENLDHLSSLEVLDVRGNLLHDLSDLKLLAKLEEFHSLYFRGVDGDDSNPVCSDPQYHTIILKMLPNLQILDGGHVQITAAFKAIEEQLNRLSVDPNSCPTPPSEPWFTQKDLHITGIGEGGDIESVINNTKTFAGPLDTQTKINDMLKEECAHLLRKSSAALTKTSK